ncbi:MAG TPA: MFS transporter [Acidiferrobacteraceae bacterium]|nr:MFS transporter [Acidiferrobacteraceae bacterium]
MSQQAFGFDDVMSAQERRTAYSLASIYATRMLGLFMILPVFTVYARQLRGHTAFLAGLALGIYGLTQALFQVPFGALSDRVGRKPILLTGLSLFVAGSVIAALSHSIYGVIIGRALQGAGAISSTVMALAADLTRDQHRTKVMATIGVSIGAAFSGGLILGPLVNAWAGVAGIFWLTAVLGVLAMGVVLWVVPDPRQSRLHRDTGVVAGLFRNVLRHRELLRLDFGIFTMQFVLTSNFVVLPVMLAHLGGVSVAHSWEIYLPVMIVAFIAMVPLIIIAEKRRRMKAVLIGAVATLALCNIAYVLGAHSLAAMVAILIVFFTAFNVLEATLPSLVAKVAPAAQKGTAMGVYSTSQFLGIFLGGTVGGALYGRFGLGAVLIACAMLLTLWFLVAARMQEPRYLSSYVLSLGGAPRLRQAAVLQQALLQVTGVVEASVVEDEEVAYLKVDRALIDEDALRRVVSGAA